MEFFKRAEVFRLKSGHQNRYLVANQDEETIEQTSNRLSTGGKWAVEVVEGKSNVIRLRNCNTYKYLACTDKNFLLGMTGFKVAQRLRLDKTVEWEPIKEGPYVKFKSHAGTFLRANGGVFPYKNSVTHDVQDHWTVKENMILWIVDIVKMADSRLENDSTATEVVVDDDISEENYTSDVEKTEDSESFGRLKSMLAALDDELLATN